ncbi:ribulose-phosphate 3-epimerase [Geobacillus sp. FSL K6-0789]|uniref:Ribulose-phosphate 3-epimerase n=1 Tax=Geobacillus stearothermophilus TaxID=1422 RepID=A0A0K9HXI0_GEOSE|nr:MULTISPECIES: ribulose-phosphate 3-epimerase [Geobacillus]KAF6512136.1 Ribulose-phosphate 3-epimerase [Geobacillus stearothermophilus]KMY57077.1 ribulose-phosphate 3-epimerase [Geobacillus stearothermophilus]KMY63595.1 ribulose-phosphate 3-epimerase [Geobacillus stearothermophilus]KMY64746.1 ribulose-phosphate 3-epimerase [Geobacillus stearothermophilus]KQC47199.1 ribulose phosphate epimerase [Geobacillus sp. Sah69]
MIRIAPSILSADFSRLAEEIRSVEEGGADWLHVDVMDGRFVPNITIGPPVVAAIRPVTKLPLDVHLMIADPDRYIPAFAKAGADIISVHAEACVHLHRTIHFIKEQGVKAGVVLNPHTPVETIRHVIADVDLVLLMTVNPGFGGQAFIPSVVPKIREVARLAGEQNKTLDIEVDGGVNAKTAPLCAEAGANVLVAGSAIYNEADRAAAIRALREACAK